MIAGFSPSSHISNSQVLFKSCGICVLRNKAGKCLYLWLQCSLIPDMMKIEDTALVLEGGGLRGVFTCGVLDCFMDHGIRFPFAVGVSRMEKDTAKLSALYDEGYEVALEALSQIKGEL